MVYPTLKRRRWSLALLAGGVALTASMMTTPAFAAELPSGDDGGQPLVSASIEDSKSGASATDELTAALVAEDPQDSANNAKSNLSPSAGASGDPAVEQEADEEGLDEVEGAQVSGQQQGQVTPVETAATNDVAPVAKAPAPAETGYTGWVVEDRNNGYGLQRYWLVNGKTTTSELLDAAETGWWAYARPEGFVVRGRWVGPSTVYVYLANNDGRLEDPGWVVTDEYDGGLQRYWIDSTTHSAIPGYSSAGWPHVTLREGYVLRGEGVFNGVKYSADNDGRVTSAAKSNGITYTRYSFTLLAMAEKEHAQDASRSVEEYAALLDPGKYSQGDSEFYQFAVLNGASHYCSAAQLNAFIARYHSEGNLAGYGQTFIDAAAANGINAEYLLAHAILESGWGTSQLASGYAYDGKTAINGKTYAAGTYYNFFGIGAYDSSPLSGGRSMAVQNGWNSVSAAISGAASWLSKWYINSATYKQDTLYEMRWDVNDVEKGDTPWHQYATGTGWATDIADVMAMIYKYTGVTPDYTYDLPSYR